MASRQRITVQDVPDSDSEGEKHVAALPNTGIQGALLQEIGDASGESFFVLYALSLSCRLASPHLVCETHFPLVRPMKTQ
jgi:hypothetical protein